MVRLDPGPTARGGCLFRLIILTIVQPTVICRTTPSVIAARAIVLRVNVGRRMRSGRVARRIMGLVFRMRIVVIRIGISV